MGALFFPNSGFLDDLWRPPSEDSSPNRIFCSCRMRRRMDGPEPSGEDLPGLGARRRIGRFALVCEFACRLLSTMFLIYDVDPCIRLFGWYTLWMCDAQAQNTEYN